MDYVKKGLDFLNKNKLYIGVAILLLVIVILATRGKEGFTDFSGNFRELAEYPGIFIEKIAGPLIGEEKMNGIYSKPKGEVVATAPEIPQLTIDAQQAKVPLDIGNGLSVDVNVEVPAQTVSVPKQSIVQLEPPKQTDVIVSAQTVQIPEQQGVIEAKIQEGSIQVPVTVPSQVVTIEEQSAKVPVMEPFRM